MCSVVTSAGQRRPRFAQQSPASIPRLPAEPPHMENELAFAIDLQTAAFPVADPSTTCSAPDADDNSQVQHRSGDALGVRMPAPLPVSFVSGPSRLGLGAQHQSSTTGTLGAIANSVSVVLQSLRKRRMSGSSSSSHDGSRPRSTRKRTVQVPSDQVCTASASLLKCTMHVVPLLC